MRHRVLSIAVRGLLAVLWGALTFAFGFVIWMYSSIEGGFDTKVGLRSAPWPEITLLGFLMMVMGPSLWWFGTLTRFAWKKTSLTWMRLVSSVLFGAVLVFDALYIREYVVWAFF